MSLSFALGVPLGELRRMPFADLQQYLAYAERHRLPAARVELMLAQVALVFAQVNGNQNLGLADFLRPLQPPADEEPEEIDPEQAAADVAQFLGYAPRKRRTEQPNKTRDTNDGKQPG